MNAVPEVPANATAQDILRLGIEAVQGPVKLACSFSLEDVAIIELAKEAGLEIGVFALDTGRLNEETYEVADALTERYRIKIDWYFPKHEAVEKLEREKGLFSFRESLENRHECCHIRKVEPLGRALQGLAGWITGMRREHNVTRTDLKAIELDQLNGGILKLNPLLDWNEAQLLQFVQERRLPQNRLLQQGYRSIGCAPCTRAVQPGEDARAGRWWWENPEHKECGLHRR
ncbi:phosphoadenylyl-sulfate reductase [Geomonas sp. Red69]|uniref:Adenosine 5'-phosphosulfate reductase n=1 Tax=Geomonas diazotrophica TaxID=2843197 RepID=A0ABX8JSI1_9BACT|nr:MULTISPECIES: phosphoadenylyl-sulfate reductase [Geomonas]MBU5637259.1 phosphoadenylyl-sulfate reductase [Geomonas diazotrophica]QWV99552.1 phosphoadenylyl-sulfate reductase [Geomonas nitrogeniifigens]QXE88727.1 phosphoadenylyl-sulfate reductase [Geomonas nitrogeniifigens]